MIDSPGSLGEPGAQPMGASGLLEGPPQTMAGPRARTSPEDRASMGDASEPTQGVQSSSLNISNSRLRGCPLPPEYLTAGSARIKPTETVPCIQHLLLPNYNRHLYRYHWQPDA